MLAREVDDRAFLRHPVAWLRERAMVFLELFAAGADIGVAFEHRKQSRCAKGRRPYARTCPSVSRAAPSRARPPATQSSRPSRNPHRRPGATGRRRTVRPYGRASSWLRRPPPDDGRRRLDVHDHRVLQVNEIIVGVGVDGRSRRPPPYSGRRIGWRDRLRLDRRRPAEGRVIENRRYSATAPLDVGSRSSTLATPRLRCASATIMLASTAKASPPTIPSFMQRATTVSNSLRSRSLSRKRPWRFFENVEWSGTSPSSPSRKTSDKPD